MKLSDVFEEVKQYHNKDAKQNITTTNTTTTIQTMHTQCTQYTQYNKQPPKKNKQQNIP